MQRRRSERWRADAPACIRADDDEATGSGGGGGGGGWASWAAAAAASPSPLQSAAAAARHTVGDVRGNNMCTSSAASSHRHSIGDWIGADRCRQPPQRPPADTAAPSESLSRRPHRRMHVVSTLILLLLALLPLASASGHAARPSLPPGRSGYSPAPLNHADSGTDSGGIDVASSSSASASSSDLSPRDFALLSLSGMADEAAEGEGGLDSFDSGSPWYTPDQPLPPDNSTAFPSTNDTAPFQVPISKRLGMWSFQCCDGCAAECGGRFVHRVCLNRTTSELINPFSCSLIPAIPVATYLDWALSNCSMANCPVWRWDGTYNSSELTCGRALAFPNVECARMGVVERTYSCFPQPRPSPIFINQSSCGASDPALSLLSFSKTNAAAPFTPRQFFDLAVLAGRIFLIGGLTRRNAQLQNLPADVWSSSNLGHTWARVPVETAAFTAVQDHTVEVIDSSLFVFGGFQNGAPSMNVWRSDDQGSNWFVSGYLLSGRAQHASAAFLDGIVIVGGFSQSSVQNSVLRSSDASHFYLQTASAAWSPRTYPRLAVLADALILCGGWLPHGVAATDVWKTYDAVQWTQVTAALPFSPRIGYVFYSSYRTLLLMGGISETGSAYHTDQWISGDSGATWQLRQAQSVPAEADRPAYVTASFSPRAWPAFIKLDEHVVVVGGEYKGLLLNDVWGATRGKTQSQLTLNPPQVDPVLPGEEPSRGGRSLSNTELLGVVIAAIVAALVVLAAVLGVWRHRRKQLRARKEPAVAERPEGVALQPVARAAALSPEEAAAAAAAAGGAAVDPDANAGPVGVGEGEVRLQLDEDESPLPAQMLFQPQVQLPAAGGGNNAPSQRSFSSSIAGSLLPEQGGAGGAAGVGAQHPQAEDRDASSHADTAPSSQVRGAQSASRSGRSRTPSAGGAHSTPKHAAMLSPPHAHHHHHGAGAGAGVGAAAASSSSAAVPAAVAASGSGRSSARNSRSLRRDKLARSNSATPRRSATDDELHNAVSSANAHSSATVQPPPPMPPMHAQALGNGGAGASPMLLHPAVLRAHPSSPVSPLLVPVPVPAATPSPAPVSPFAIDPAQVAWMQAQIQYQASVLAAVVAAQQQQLQAPGAASSAAAVAAATAAAAAAVAAPILPPVIVGDAAAGAAGEEYFCSVPQLSQQQAQVVYVSPSPLALQLQLPPVLSQPNTASSSASASASPSAPAFTLDELEPGANAHAEGETDTADGGCGARAHSPLDSMAAPAPAPVPAHVLAATNSACARGRSHACSRLQVINESDTDACAPGE